MKRMLQGLKNKNLTFSFKNLFFRFDISTGAGTQLQVQRLLVHHLAAPSFEPEMHLKLSFLPVLSFFPLDRRAGVQTAEREPGHC